MPKSSRTNKNGCACLSSQFDFGKFWKSTNKLSSGPGLSAVIEGVGEPQTIANLFKDLFSVQSSQKLSVGVPDAEINLKYNNTFVNAKTVTKIIQSMIRGKSPGHDSLSIEHLQHAGPRLAELIAFLFNLCIVHSYLPPNLMRTVVVPIVKNKTGDSANSSNYRPISLATIIAKILDSMLSAQLDCYLHIHELQFGFRAQLSTESAILS